MFNICFMWITSAATTRPYSLALLIRWSRFNPYPQSPTKAHYGASLAPCGALSKEAQLSFNFQSFPMVDPPLPRKELLLLSLYCLIQTASLFENILGFLVKVGKIIKKNNKKIFHKIKNLMKKKLYKFQNICPFHLRLERVLRLVYRIRNYK